MKLPVAQLHSRQEADHKGVEAGELNDMKSSGQMLKFEMEIHSALTEAGKVLQCWHRFEYLVRSMTELNLQMQPSFVKIEVNSLPNDFLKLEYWLPAHIHGKSSHAVMSGIEDRVAVLEERLLALQAENEKLRVDISARDSFSLAVLGDLHIDPSCEDAHIEARQHIKNALCETAVNRHMVSLGDLGGKASAMTYPCGTVGNAGTSACFRHAKDFLDGFDLPYSLVLGNHDLEGMEEFDTDEKNIKAWEAAFKHHIGDSSPHFQHYITEKTLLVGLSTTRFRNARGSSHEVYIDDKGLDWFEKVLEKHPASLGWHVIVFTHAPPMGCGLRVMQDVHIKNGCAWLNHSGDGKRGKLRRRIFMNLVRKHACIRAWFSGHFHLSHDYDDSLGWGDVGTGDDCDEQMGRCLFVACGVIGKDSQRDGRRQTRLVRGDRDGLRVYTINHHRGGLERLDAELKYRFNGQPPKLERIEVRPEESSMQGDEAWFSAYVPQDDDGCYIQTPLNGTLTVPPSQVCWWHMDDGAVLGMHDGMLVEYDSQTKSPLGVVLDKEELEGKEVQAINNNSIVVIVGSETGKLHKVVHPNEDGRYWRQFQKNKLFRMQCKRRESWAEQWFKEQLSLVQEAEKAAAKAAAKKKDDLEAATKAAQEKAEAEAAAKEAAREKTAAKKTETARRNTEQEEKAAKPAPKKAATEAVTKTTADEEVAAEAQAKKEAKEKAAKATAEEPAAEAAAQKAAGDEAVAEANFRKQGKENAAKAVAEETAAKKTADQKAAAEAKAKQEAEEKAAKAAAEKAAAGAAARKTADENAAAEANAIKKIEDEAAKGTVAKKAAEDKAAAEVVAKNAVKEQAVAPAAKRRAEEGEAQNLVDKEDELMKVQNAEIEA